MTKITRPSIVLICSLIMVGLIGCSKDTDLASDTSPPTPEIVTEQPMQSTLPDSAPSEIDDSQPNEIELALPEPKVLSDYATFESDTPQPPQTNIVINSEPQAPDISNSSEADYNQMVGYGLLTQSLYVCDSISQSEFAIRKDRGLNEPGFTPLSPDEYLKAFNEGVKESNAKFAEAPSRKEANCAELIEFKDAMVQFGGIINSMHEIEEDLKEQGWEEVPVDE